MLFGTTDQFLERMGINSVADLPPVAEFVPGADVVEALEHGLRIDADAEVEREDDAETEAEAEPTTDETAYDAG